jgi:hypothetical protein
MAQRKGPALTQRRPLAAFSWAQPARAGLPAANRPDGLAKANAGQPRHDRRDLHNHASSPTAACDYGRSVGGSEVLALGSTKQPSGKTRAMKASCRALGGGPEGVRSRRTWASPQAASGLIHSGDSLIARSSSNFMLNLIAYNLIRIPKLLTA